MADKQSQTFYVDGMHCAACEVFLEDKLKGAPGVCGVKAKLSESKLVIESETQLNTASLNELVSEGGYTLRTEPLKQGTHLREFIIAVPAAMFLVLAFIFFQKVGVVDFVNTDTVSYSTAFLIGLVASVSSCLAVVGGLVLSLSASAAKRGVKHESQITFHLSRLISFFVLGGVIGLLGKFVEFGLIGHVILNSVVAIVMLILGLNLLDTFPGLRKFEVHLPKVFGRLTLRESRSSGLIAPVLVGAATFFLPCGFTQSMQLYTLTTGSFVVGGLTMLSFALGTLPVLALLSFSSFEISQKPWKGIFFKVAGLIVIVLAVVNLWNGLILLGIV